jgi:hypothetical protein
MDHADELLARIHAGRIRPVPRWRVRLGLAGRFALFASALGLGTLSVALAVQEIHAHAGRGWLLRRAMAEFAPYVWALTAVLMVWAGIRIFRELPRGWRVRPWMAGLAIAAFCLLGGVALERGEALLGLHRLVARAVPAYREAWIRKAMASWHDPSRGRLAGSWAVPSDSSSGEPILVAVDGARWTVRWEGGDGLPRMPALRLLGRVCGERVFCADDWRPAPGIGKFRREKR